MIKQLFKKLFKWKEIRRERKPLRCDNCGCEGKILYLDDTAPAGALLCEDCIATAGEVD